MNQPLLSTLQAGLKIGFDIDPAITEHVFQSTQEAIFRSFNLSTELFRTFGSKLPAIATIVDDIRSMRPGGQW